MKTRLLCLAALLSNVTGCAMTGTYESFVHGAGGALINVQTTHSSVEPGVPGLMTAESCAFNFLGLFAWGDNSVAAAKLKKRITRVATVDADIVNILGIFGKICTVITGTNTDVDMCTLPRNFEQASTRPAAADTDADTDRDGDEGDAQNEVRMCDGNELVIIKRGNREPFRADCATVFSRCESQERAACQRLTCKDASEHVYTQCSQHFSNGGKPVDKAAFYAMCEQKRINDEWSNCQINCFTRAACDLPALLECHSGRACANTSDGVW